MVVKFDFAVNTEDWSEPSHIHKFSSTVNSQGEVHASCLWIAQSVQDLRNAWPGMDRKVVGRDGGGRRDVVA